MSTRQDCPDMCEFLESTDSFPPSLLPRYFPISPVLVFEEESDKDFPELNKSPVYAKTFQELYHHAFGHILPGIKSEESGDGMTSSERLYLEACCMHRLVSAAPYATSSVYIGEIPYVEQKVSDLWLRSNGTVERIQPELRYESLHLGRKTRIKNRIIGVNVTPININAEVTQLPSVYELQCKSTVFVHQQWGIRNLENDAECPFETIYMTGADLFRRFRVGTTGQRVFITHRELKVDGVKLIIPKIEHVMLMNSRQAIDDPFAIEVAQKLLTRIEDTRDKSHRIKEAKRQYYRHRSTS